MNLLRTTIYSIFIATLFCACSSGSANEDIVEVKSATISGRININDVSAWTPATHKLVFRSYLKSDRKELAFEKELVKNESGAISFKLDELPIGILAETEIALVDLSDDSFSTRMYYGSFVVRAGDEIELPNFEITLGGDAPEFLLTKIEDKIFAPKCFSCHNSKKADLELDLSKWNTYANVVNVNSKLETSKVLVKPNNAASSFFYEMLEHPELAPKMLPVLMTDSEMALIKRWINEGAMVQ